MKQTTNEIILSDLKQNLKNQLGNNLNNLILFGSHAKGNANDYSDYDILVVLNDKYTWKDEKRISDTCYSIDLKYDIFTDIHIISSYELNYTIRGKEPLFINAIKNGVYA
jgi:uncharacterized protein